MQTANTIKPFHFKQFTIEQDRCSMKVGTDGILLGAWADVAGVNNILDIGTGTGVIAIMLAQRALQAEIHAVEIDEAAWSQALDNMKNAPWADRLHAHLDAIQHFVKKTSLRFDLVVSNPPFFSGGTLSNSQDKTSVRHTIKLPHGDLLAAVRTLLTPDGRFCVVLPYLEGLRFREMANSYHLFCTKMTDIKPKEGKAVERLLLQFERSVKRLEKDELVIQNGGVNEWTEEFRALTGEFYLKA
jgi:tRNA1Val (adenine37-N6)-methyltransferase